MRIKTLLHPKEMFVVAITWPKERSKYKVLESAQTQFSAFDGSHIQDFYAQEFEVIDPDINSFVFHNQFDERYFCLFWRPMLTANLWQKVRDYDRSALNELKDIIELKLGK